MSVEKKFSSEAMDELQAAVCDFMRTLIDKASENAEADKRETVARGDVEQAVEEMIDGPDQDPPPDRD